jgi:thiamine transport system substrate-binding protein
MKKPKFTTSAMIFMFIVTLVGCAPESGSMPEREINLIAYDSFVMDEAVKQQFETETGYKLNIMLAGSALEMANKLQLTKDKPVADIVYGIDNFTSQKLVNAGVFESDNFKEIARGDVCINADKNYFESNKIEYPQNYGDILYRLRGTMVFENPQTSSPGFAFWASWMYNSIKNPSMFNPIGVDNWGRTLPGYGNVSNEHWAAVHDMVGVIAGHSKVVDSWSDAYYTDFSAGEGKGKYPLVVSYASSPAATVTEDVQDSTTTVLDWSCVKVTESAGVLTNANNPEGARSVLNFLQSSIYQASLPESLYLYPIDETVELPENWAKFAPLPERSLEIDNTWVEQEYEVLLNDFKTAKAAGDDQATWPENQIPSSPSPSE